MVQTTNSKRKRPNPVPESSSEDNSSPGIQVETAPVEESQQEISATPTSAATPTPAKASTASLPSQSAKDGSPSDSTSQAKKPRSDVWIHFKKQGNGANTRATCNYCKTAMNGQSVNGTSTLWRHLTQCHSYKTSSKQALLKLNGPNSAVSNWVFSQEVSRDLLVKMVIAHELPFRFVQYTLGRVLGDFRTRMAANTLEALVCAQDWIRTEQGLHQTDEEEDEGKDEDGDDDDVVEL
ncbi:hypothetical protein MJO29_012763 [Puccinia striiformis f. sp. tritici]|nr:hypothetical protein MJO29_012763 [Puccinia striiformis f. sp. tritici]